MCVKYNAVFVNKYTNVNTQIIMGDNGLNYISPMIINGIIIETDGFEVLSIDTVENYTADQLNIFDYDIKNNFYILKNYSLKIEIPVNVFEKSAEKETSENIIIELTDKKNGKMKIRDKNIEINRFELLNSFDVLYKEINKKYEIKICAFCKNSCWNPYGGTDFCNHLCFKIFSNEYYKINNRSKVEIVKLMEKYTGKYENVYLTNSCEEYMEK